MLFLLQIAWYGHGPCTYWSARHPLPELRVKKFTRGHLGSQGSKGNFHQKCYFSFRLHDRAMGLVHIDQLDTLYKRYGSRNSPGVTWGHRGQKLIFCSKCCISSMLNSLTIKTHAYALAWDPLPMLWGQISTWGHLGSHSSNFDFQDKIVWNCQCNIVQSCDWYVCFSVHSNLRSLIYVMGSQVTTGSLGSQ